MRFHVLTAAADFSFFNLPLLAVRHALGERGLSFRLFYSITSQLHACDAILINSKFFKPWFVAGRRTEVLQMLETLSQTSTPLIWFDTTDSTGTTQFEVLPYVRTYAKAQLLRDRSIYGTHLYGARLFTDYYHRHFGVTDVLPEVTLTPLKPVDAGKLRLSWNSALGCGWTRRYMMKGLYAQIFTQLSQAAPSLCATLPPPLKQGHVEFSSPGSPRPIKLTCRIQSSYARNTIRYQRLQVIQRLEKRRIPVTRLPSQHYFQELRRSRVGLSPFGWGEVCLRDWDLLAAGSMLLKPDMSHLETWPDLFRPGETYMPLAWDFSDFDRVIDQSLSEPARAQSIAERAQYAYEEVLSDAGVQIFCDRLTALIGV